MRDDFSSPAPGQGPPDRLDELLRPPTRVRLIERASSWWRSRLGRSPILVVAPVLVLGLAAAAWWWTSAPDGSPVDLSGLPRAGTTVADAASAGAPTTAPPGSSSVDPDGPTVAPDTTGIAGGVVTVDVAGAVVEPGVRRLAPGSRVADAIAAAGGSRPEADLDRVNRAAALIDGARVWIPSRGQPDPSPVAIEAPAGSADGGGTLTTPIDLNSATAAQLDALPGVGPATASAIVAYRSTHGPFGTVDELGDVRGIGPAKLETIRPLVRVGS